jgi:hypothetical protein
MAGTSRMSFGTWMARVENYLIVAEFIFRDQTDQLWVLV